MIFDITRLTRLAGQVFTSPKCRVTNPHITARESIEIGDYIVAQQKRIAELEQKLSHAETMGDKAQSIFALEQQAKACTDLKAMWEKAKSYKFEIEDLQTRADYLLGQAKQLKEHKADE